MAKPTSREQLKEYALRKLGAPVIEINVDDAQLEDAIDDSLQIFAEYHFDGVERAFFKYEITDTDISNGFIDTNSIGVTQGNDDTLQVEAGSEIVSIYKIFQFDEGGAGTNMFSVNYQIALNDLYGIRTGQHGKLRNHKKLHGNVTKHVRPRKGYSIQSGHKQVVC